MTGLLLLATLLSQAPIGGPVFEVASIRPSVPVPAVAGARARSGAGGGGGVGGCPQRLKIDSSRVDIGCATPVMLIAYALRFPPGRVTGPEWLIGPAGGRFDIAAEIPQGASANQVPEMLQALLIDRFGLAIHRGTTIQPIYALVVAKGGLKVTPAAADSGAVPETMAGTTAFAGEIIERSVPNADGKGQTNTIVSLEMGTVHVTEKPELAERLDAPAISPEGVAQLLERMMPVETLIVDMTGLKGRYRLVLEISLNGLPKLAPSGIGDSTAVASWRADREEEVLKRFNDGLRKSGLQLERRRAPIEALVVDHWEKVPTRN